MAEGTISGWVEGALLSIAVVLILALIITNMNTLYDEDYQIGMGTNTSGDDFVEYQQQADELIKGGEADFNSNDGITLRSSWAITKNAYKITMAFVTGGFLEDTITYMNLGEGGQILAKYLRIIWTIGLIFAVLYILFKVIP